MKNIFLILISIFWVFSLNAQDVTRTKYMPTGDTYYKYTGVAGDTVSDGQDSLSFVLALRKHNVIRKIDVRVSMEKTRGTPKNVLKLNGKIAEDDSWTAITNTTVWGTVDSVTHLTLTPTKTIVYDTTKIMNHAAPTLNALYYATETTNDIFYNWIEVLIIDSDSNTTATLNDIEVKLWYY